MTVGPGRPNVHYRRDAGSAANKGNVALLDPPVPFCLTESAHRALTPCAATCGRCGGEVSELARSSGSRRPGAVLVVSACVDCGLVAL